MSVVVFVIGSYCYNLARICAVLVESRSIRETYNYLQWEICKATSKNQKMSVESLSSCEYAYQDYQMLKATSPEMSIKSEIICLHNFKDLIAGTSFVVSGVVLKHCERFSVNLMAANNKQDIALHINPRLPQNYIVRNSRINGNWGDEETCSQFSLFSLLRGHRFSIEILVTESEYLMAVNGRHFGTYDHRIPYKKVIGIEVKGDVKDIEIEQKVLETYPQILPMEIPIQNDKSSDIDNNSSIFKVPYYGKLAESLTNGKTLHIIGKVKLLPHSITINLQQTNYIFPHPIIALHFNPRFGNQGGRHVICRNSWTNGKWLKEERTDSSSDFMPGKIFHLKFVCQHESYQILLNDKFFAEYTFRADPSVVDTINVYGDILLKNVYVENKVYD